MKLRFIIGITCLFTIPLQLFAQRTITKRLCPSCRPYAQYQVNANGEYNGFFKSWDTQGRLAGTLNYQHGQLHGMCVTYFENGSINEQAEYYQGTQISLKIYAYKDGKRKLVRNATWDRSGNIITDGDNAGKLPNGRWRFNYPRYGDYSETYNGNDTLYVWDDRAKQRFLGKQFDGVFIKSEERMHNDAVKDIEDTNTKYSNYITVDLENSEYNLYSFISTYLEIGDNDELKDMIIDAIGVPVDVVELNFIVDSIDNDEQFATIVVTNKITNEIIANLPSCNKANDLYLKQANYKNANSKQELNEAKLKQKRQAKLLSIVEYCYDNDIP